MPYSYIDLWKLLLEGGCQSACYGLLLDMILGLEMSTDLASTEKQKKKRLRFEEDNAALAEELMTMIEDHDGNMLKEWLQLFRTDRQTFADRANELITNLIDRGN